MGAAGRGGIELLPMPGEAGAAGRGGGAIGATAGFAAMGFGAAMGFAATAGLRAGALRAVGFFAVVLRAEGIFAVVLRAEVFFAVVLRAVARFAVVFRAGAFFVAAPVLRAIFRTARAVLRAVFFTARTVFLAVLRGLVFLLVVRFFPLVFVAMASAPICSVAPCDRPSGRVVARIALHWSRLAVPSAMAKIGVDEPGPDPALPADHQGCGDRQQPPAMALKLFAELPVALPNLVADPEDEAERERISQIEVGQHPERQSPRLLQDLGVFGGFRHYRPPAATISG
jgi:hypothetical protein